MRFDLSDDEWALLEPLMPKSRKSARADDRRILNAIFYVLRTGMPWRDLPERYGPYTTAYNRFNRWSRRGIWKRIFDTLASALLPTTPQDRKLLLPHQRLAAHRHALRQAGPKLPCRRNPRRGTLLGQVVSPDPSHFSTLDYARIAAISG
jgi:transposase